MLVRTGTLTKAFFEACLAIESAELEHRKKSKISGHFIRQESGKIIKELKNELDFHLINFKFGEGLVDVKLLMQKLKDTTTYDTITLDMFGAKTTRYTFCTLRLATCESTIKYLESAVKFYKSEHPFYCLAYDIYKTIKTFPKILIKYLKY